MSPRAGALTLLLVAGCGPAGPDAAERADPARWPAGTAVAVDGEPIAVAEVDRIADWVRPHYPERSRVSWRRTALTWFLLPRAAVASERAAERRAAREASAAAREALVAGTGEAEVRQASGTWGELGLEIWSRARELEPGTWSAPFEAVGRFLLIRLDEAPPPPAPGESVGAQRLRVSLVEHLYLPADAGPDAVEAAIDGARLEIVDPDFEEVVPESWKLRMSDQSH